ncbi:Midasin [Wickerhamomyces ciferrii]|uniref:Midasin n=1 Tax=Wickerhamomyces ciferrii (strain ATCC 14091 / BCRC 22168 / CBS 111 / JCM 3599 / NBRC 0793 / NRRL Y-1031 F-60-10) TaxID=1206466 RepID=K0KEN8_WICCF|nr:Midasin [Wickerhamomyces ciferrii]CCH43600.1 Midasin [Wickerhamomyces ciferrii]
MSIEEQNAIEIDIDHPTPLEIDSKDDQVINVDEDITIGEGEKQDDDNELDLLSEDLPEDDNDDDDHDMNERIEDEDISKTEQLEDEEIGDDPESATIQNEQDYDMDGQNNESTIYYEAMNTTTNAESPIDYISPEKINDDVVDNENKSIETNDDTASGQVEELDDDQADTTLNEPHQDQDQHQNSTELDEINHVEALSNDSINQEHESKETIDETSKNSNDGDDVGVTSKIKGSNATTIDDKPDPVEDITTIDNLENDSNQEISNDEPANGDVSEVKESHNDVADLNKVDGNAKENVEEVDLQEPIETQTEEKVDEVEVPKEDGGAVQDIKEEIVAGEDKENDDDKQEIEEEHHEALIREEKEEQEESKVDDQEGHKVPQEDQHNQEEEEHAAIDHTSPTSSQNVDYCPIPILLRTNVFPYLLCPVSPDVHEKLTSELENVITLFDDSSVLQFTLTQILEQVKEIFKENDNPFDEDEELVLTFKEFGNTSIEETSVLADTLYIYDIIEMFQIVIDNADGESRPDCLYIDLNSRKSFRSQMSKIWALKKHSENDHQAEEGTTNEEFKRDETIDFELSEDEPDAENDVVDDEKDEETSVKNDVDVSKSSVESGDSAKRPIDEIENGEDAAESSTKRQKEEQ